MPHLMVHVTPTLVTKDHQKAHATRTRTPNNSTNNTGTADKLHRLRGTHAR